MPLQNWPQKTARRATGLVLPCWCCAKCENAWEGHQIVHVSKLIVSRQHSVRQSHLPRFSPNSRCVIEKKSATIPKSSLDALIWRDHRTVLIMCPCVNSGRSPVLLSAVNWRHLGAHRETVHRITYCLRRRFAVASGLLISGCGLPVTMTGVPLQTPHQLMR